MLAASSLVRKTGKVARYATLERLSIELTRICNKGCDFCYNGSNPRGATVWTVADVLTLTRDCVRNGLRAVSFGGGEPLQFEGLFHLLTELQGTCFRSLTSNGLLLGKHFDRLVDAGPDKVHLSLHYPDDPSELQRVVEQIHRLEQTGIANGVNLLVRQSQLPSARAASLHLQAQGISLSRLLFLPMRGADTPTAKDLAWVAANPRFQSMTCLLACGSSPRFASLDWNRHAAWCSYTASRRPIEELSHRGVVRALQGQALLSCG